MTDDWDFYPLVVEGKPASIYVNLGLAQKAPVKTQPHMGYVRVFMRRPREDGLSSNEEFRPLLDMEDALVNGVATSGIATFCGRNTSGGNRDFYFYTSDLTLFMVSVGKVMTGLPEYEFQTGGRFDPDWNAYFDFLYPSPDDLQRITNRRVIANLETHGDVLSKLRTIDHFVLMPSIAAAESLRAFLIEHGFTTYEPTIEGGAVTLRFERADRPDAIDDLVIPIARKVTEMGGSYDGWGCVVVN
jgi:uncharacterized protein (TIGR01619 family)